MKETVQVTREDELRALIEKATQDDLADDGRYFSGSCSDLTQCRHSEVGEYQNSDDGKLVEFLWNNRRDYLARLSATFAPAGVDEPFLSQLRRVNTDRYHAWVGDGEDAGILFDAAELGGEVGELLNVVKKLEREARGWRGSRAAPEDFADECADVLICLDKLARRMDVDLEAATVRKFNATSEKVDLPHRLAAAPAPSGQEVAGEPFGYWIEQKGAEPALLRKPAYIPEPSDLRTVTPLYTTPPASGVPADVRRLVIAARNVAFGDEDAGARAELDAASEAFAGRVAWDDAPPASGVTAPDECQFCLGAKGGVNGNENVINGVIACDYCSALLRSASGVTVPVGERFVIRRNGAFFRPNAAGYTNHVVAAGFYTREEADAYADVEGVTIEPLARYRAEAERTIAEAQRLIAALSTPSATPGEDRPLEEHQCWRPRLGRLSHRQWMRDGHWMLTCGRCGTPIDLEHKETGPVSWTPPERATATPGALDPATVERLTRIRASMGLLQNNSEGCALNHYGGDAETHGVPGWLADTRRDLEALTNLIATDPHQHGGKGA